jgi:hypothetical protein
MKISERQLRRLVREELERLDEDVDHAAIKDVVSKAQKLLAAVESFQEGATDAMLSSVTGLDELKSTLENMVSAPGSYVVNHKTKKVVHMKPASSDVTTGDDVL